MVDTDTDDTDQYNAWMDEAVAIADAFVQDDCTLGELMMEEWGPFWDHCYYDGFTPQQAMEILIKLLSGEEGEIETTD
jgi:hypothetical protein